MEENTEEIKDEDLTAAAQEETKGIQISDDVISIEEVSVARIS